MTPALPAASVILLRAGQVYLVRRHAQASFMKLSYVFPGGGVDPADESTDLAAIRELFEEAGVLLCKELPDAAALRRLRDLVFAPADFATTLAAHGLHPDPSRLRLWARWVTPSVEPRRFDATFFVAELPGGQTPEIDGREVIEERWMTPAEALLAHEQGEIRLPPPQIRMLFELAFVGSERDWDSALARRLDRSAWILPRLARLDGAHPALLLPWDPEYWTAGTGEGHPLPSGHPWAWGPSRFVLERDAWRLRDAPGGGGHTR